MKILAGKTYIAKNGMVYGPLKQDDPDGALYDGSPSGFWESDGRNLFDAEMDLLGALT